MIKTVSEKIAKWIVCNDPDNADNYEVFVYVAQSAIGLLLSNAILLTIAAIIGLPLQALLWAVFYNALRFFIGGGHAKTFFLCMLGGTIFAVLCVVATNYLVSSPIFLVVEVGISIAVTFWVAPVVHENRLMTVEHINKNHRTGKMIVIIESALVVLFYFVFVPWVAHSAGLGMLSAAVLCIIGKLTAKKEG